ncbi:MAG TPA: class I SAM-dependent methyltransferase, partial [Caldithrix sp.]|nr:class I SAM-dependent methyltransferase [Caldithrix sp.]
MKMTLIEKRFVNRKKKSERNIKIIESDFKLMNLTKTNTILELGCGVGFVSVYLAENYQFNVFGTDFDDEQIDTAKRIQPEIKNLHFQVEDASQLTIEDSSINLVISQNVFHHVPNWQDAIKEIARVLCPGGYLTWLDLTFSNLVKNIFLPFVKNYGLYTIEDIKSTFFIHGFKQLLQEQTAHGLMNQH